MTQQALMALERYGKTTPRARFLAGRERIVRWPELMAVVEPFYDLR